MKGKPHTEGKVCLFAWIAVLTPLSTPLHLITANTIREKKYLSCMIQGSFFRSVRQNIQSKLQEVTMKIPKLFKKAVAFVMLATVLLRETLGRFPFPTPSFSHIYDSNSNAIRYNSSANIGGYTAGRTGNYKYRMLVDGENVFCIQLRVPLKTGNTLKKTYSDTWNALSAN